MSNYSKEYLKALEESYVNLVRPRSLIEYFKDDVEFKEWAELGSILDLRACLRAFEKDEQFHHCAIIKEVLTSKMAPVKLNKQS